MNKRTTYVNTCTNTLIKTLRRNTIRNTHIFTFIISVPKHNATDKAGEYT